MSVANPPIVREAVEVIQEHLDREARNRRLVVLPPKELCAQQKQELIRDLLILLR